MTRLLRTLIVLAAALGTALASATVASAELLGGGSLNLSRTVDQILAQPYQPNYVPLGFDTAFPDQPVPNTFPSEDYTSGSKQGDPDAPPWPRAFRPVLLISTDGAPLLGYYAMHVGRHPGIVVVHGFNSNGKDSVVRWAAMLYANGYNVAAIDQRDFPPEYRAGYGYPRWLQTFGWKESEDVVTAGRFLASQPGVTSVGLVGFSLGGLDTVLALALDQGRLFKAGLNFSGPADQNTQIYSTASPPGCRTPSCTYPATGALMLLVTPPNTYADPCRYLNDAAAYYRSIGYTDTTPYTILSREDAFQKQLLVRVPLLNVYAADDPLVQGFHARMMAGYNVGNPNQRTFMLQRGAHAYYYDRWWQQRAILLYFKNLMVDAFADPTVSTTPTVNQTPGGPPAGAQLADLGTPSRANADALLAPYICDTSRPSPATASVP